MDVEEDWLDLVFGARIQTPINKQWTLLSLGTRYQLNGKMLLDFADKATWVDYESGTKRQPGYLAYDTITHGPLAGFICEF